MTILKVSKSLLALKWQYLLNENGKTRVLGWLGCSESPTAAIKYVNEEEKEAPFSIPELHSDLEHNFCNV